MKEEEGRNKQALKVHKCNEAWKGSARGVGYVSPFLERACTLITIPERTEVLYLCKTYSFSKTDCK